jgi:hypothetical protein
MGVAFARFAGRIATAPKLCYFIVGIRKDVTADGAGTCGTEKRRRFEGILLVKQCGVRVFPERLALSG